VHEVAVRKASHVLGGGNDLAAPLADLAGSVQFIIFGIKAEKLALFAFMVTDLAFELVLLLLLIQQGAGRRSFDTRSVPAQEFFFAILRCQ
jgi:hypothetical protein